MSLKSSCKPVIVAVALILASAGCTTIVRSSSAPNGTGANSASAPTGASTLSDNGRYGAFSSTASNLVPGDTNGVSDIFRHDNVSGTTVRISVDTAGHQLSTPSGGFAMSGDGRHVLFTTETSLVPGDTNNALDVYVRSVDAGTTEWVSIKPDGTPVIGGFENQSLARTTISDDGRYVLVTDSLPGQGHAYLRDRTTHTTTVLAELARDAMLAGDGEWMVEVHLCTGGPCSFESSFVATDGSSFERISDGCAFQAFSVSADARYVVGDRAGQYPTFECPGANGLVRWDRVTKQAVQIGFNPQDVTEASISNDGRFVAVLNASGLLQVVDMKTGARHWVDTDASGQRPGPPTERGSISGNGRYVAVGTPAALTPDDTNGLDDVFTHFTVPPQVDSVSPATARGASHVTLQVRGQNFLPHPAVTFPGGGVTVHGVRLVNPSRIDVEVSVDADAPTGSFDVVVTNTGVVGGAHALCRACLTIS